MLVYAVFLFEKGRSHMAEYSGAIDYFVDESRVFIDQNSHNAIVIHGTGGSPDQTAQQLGDYFRTNAAMVSSHFGIDRVGNIAQYVLLKDGAAANCCVTTGHDTFWDQFNGENLNWHTISIEHVNDATNSLPLTDLQKQASFKLIAWLCNQYNIAPDHIKSHASIDPVNKSLCPGPQYPWNDLFTFLKGAPMTTLEGFPMVSQLDGDINAQFDCVSASIAAALEYLTKQSYTSAQVKDAVYGRNYQGNTDPARYVDYCTQHGVRLSSINGTDNTALIRATKQQLAQNKPVLLTEVDPYLPAGSGETHVVVAYACNANSITVMDPFIAAPVTKTDQQWQNDLRSHQIWTTEQEITMLTIDQASQYFVEVVPDQRWHCKQTNIEIAYGMLNYYRTCTQVGLNGLSQYGLPLSGEEGVPNTKQAILQRFERGVIMYDPANEVDNVPGISGTCYPAHIDKGPGQDPRLLQLQSQIVQLQVQIAALQKQEATQLPKQWYDALLPLKPLVDTLS
jgi:N-acetyl-anhydromuramyl-L-alanine amidase AmpD